LNEGTSEEKKYKYATKEPLKGQIEEEKSYFKFDENKVKWQIHKVDAW